MTAGDIALAAVSIAFAVQAGYNVVLTLYAWEDDAKHRSNGVPSDFEPPSTAFTVLLPARHEEDVIQDTIQRTVDLRYPAELVQVLVVIEAGDTGTISRVEGKINELRSSGVHNVRLLTFADPPINKPHGLNVGLSESSGFVVTILDAEDEPHPDILNVVNTVMIREDVTVVQCGVQLMNYDDHWFSALNVLEYFFWFKSRLHYHATLDMVPLGGNTVFIRRDLIERIGRWDQNCLTEDADLGIRLGVAELPVRVLHDDRYVTREETPHSVSQLVKQRTRWDQGFLQVLAKRDWSRLPKARQRFLALYVLGFPLLQALMMLYLPFSLYAIFFLKVPDPIALLAFLPLFVLIGHFVVTMIGFYEFTSAHGLRPSLFSFARTAFAYLPYQWLLSYAAFRAIWRLARRNNSWEKTSHTGVHRTPQRSVAPTFVEPSSSGV